MLSRLPMTHSSRQSKIILLTILDALAEHVAVNDLLVWFVACRVFKLILKCNDSNWLELINHFVDSLARITKQTFDLNAVGNDNSNIAVGKELYTLRFKFEELSREVSILHETHPHLSGIIIPQNTKLKDERDQCLAEINTLKSFSQKHSTRENHDVCMSFVWNTTRIYAINDRICAV